MGMFVSADSRPSLRAGIKRKYRRGRSLFLCAVMAVALVGPLGCRKPEMPDLSSITGPGRLKDITQVRRGMSPNEVRWVMGTNYKTIYEEGLQGMDMGIYIWEYPEGRVYFNTNGAFKAVPFK